MQYIKGLTDLGHDAYFVEDSGDDAWLCYDPEKNTQGSDPTYGLAFAKEVFEFGGLEDHWAFYNAHEATWCGPCADRIDRILLSADLLLNLAFANPLRPWQERIPHRALIDTDPAFTQIRHLSNKADRERAQAHSAFFSYGCNFGTEHCEIPDDGFPWQSTRPPVVTSAWSCANGSSQAPYTTVMRWESDPSLEYKGRRYGMKSVSFAPYLDLPRKVDSKFEIALGDSRAPGEVLRANGWTLQNPLQVTKSLQTYQRYIQGSKAEFAIAKEGYVVSRGGWFSERSANYLASGRPVITQETGFSDWLQTGRGVLPFRSKEGALAAVENINGRYEMHCRAAREVAAEHFNSHKVLASLVERAMGGNTREF